MIENLNAVGFVGVIILGRIGSCLMLLPGFGSSRIPMRIRSLLAVAVSLAMFPLLFDQTMDIYLKKNPSEQITLLVVEIFNGVLLGLLARLFMVGLQFSATIVTNTIGLAPTPGAPMVDTEAVPPLVNFVSLCGTMIVFTSGMHLVLIKAIIESYYTVRMGSAFDIGWHIDQILSGLAKTSSLGLRLSAPYIIYSIIVNLAIGYVNKFTPQISVYFVTTGLVAIGGLFILLNSINDWLSLFQQDFLSAFG